MKYLLIAFLFSILIIPFEEGLEGKYKMVFEQEYSSQNCTINFNDNTYKRKLFDGKTLKGDIQYTNRDVILKDHSTGLQMKFFKSDMANDTISFGTSHINDRDSGDIIIYSGQLIRLK